MSSQTISFLIINITSVGFYQGCNGIELWEMWSDFTGQQKRQGLPEEGSFTQYGKRG